MTSGTYRRKRISLVETSESHVTSWGVRYYLYTDNSLYESESATYYTEYTDNSDELAKVGEFSTLDEAVAAFKDHMRFIEEMFADDVEED